MISVQADIDLYDANIDLYDANTEDMLDELLTRDLKGTRFDQVLANLDMYDLQHVLKQLGCPQELLDWVGAQRNQRVADHVALSRWKDSCAQR